MSGASKSIRTPGKKTARKRVNKLVVHPVVDPVVDYVVDPVVDPVMDPVVNPVMEHVVDPTTCPATPDPTEVTPTPSVTCSISISRGSGNDSILAVDYVELQDTDNRNVALQRLAARLDKIFTKEFLLAKKKEEEAMQQRLLPAIQTKMDMYLDQKKQDDFGEPSRVIQTHQDTIGDMRQAILNNNATIKTMFERLENEISRMGVLLRTQHYHDNCKYQYSTDETENLQLLDIGVVRNLFTRQLEKHIEAYQDVLLKAEDPGIVAKWIMDFSQWIMDFSHIWEKEYETHVKQKRDTLYNTSSKEQNLKPLH